MDYEINFINENDLKLNEDAEKKKENIPRNKFENKQKQRKSKQCPCIVRDSCKIEDKKVKSDVDDELRKLKEKKINNVGKKFIKNLETKIESLKDFLENEKMDRVIICSSIKLICWALYFLRNEERLNDLLYMADKFIDGEIDENDIYDAILTLDSNSAVKNSLYSLLTDYN
jgi:uncharacterized membrane protein YheB (UPF0754 family)